MTQSLKDYIGNKKVLFENYTQEFAEMDSRKEIVFARVALFEETESVSVQVDDGRANLSTQLYGIDISIVRGYKRDDHTRGEFPLNDLKDKIIEWSKQVNASALTNGYIYTFSYSGSTQYVRENRMVHRTLTFSSIRDLHKNQTE